MKDDYKGISVTKIRKKNRSSINKEDNIHQEETNDFKKNKKKNRNEFVENTDINRFNVDEELDFGKYLTILFRYRYIIFSIIIFSFLVGLILQKRVVLKYRATTKILIHNESVISPLDNKSTQNKFIGPKDLVAVLKSPLVTSIAANLLNNRVTSNDILKMIDIKIPQKNDIEKNVIIISAVSPRKKVAADVANSLYMALVNYYNNNREQEIRKILKFLKNEISEKEDSLLVIQNQINKLVFGNSNKDKIPINNDIPYITLEQYNNFQKELSDSKIKLIVVNSKIKELRKRLKEADNNIVSQMTYSEPLKIKLMNLQVDLARALTKYTEKHPKVIEIKKNIDNLKKMINKKTMEKIEFKNLSVNPIHQKIINAIIENETEKISLEEKIKALKNIIADKSKVTNNIELDKLNSKKQALIGMVADLQKKYSDLTVNLSFFENRFEQLIKAEASPTPINRQQKKKILIISVFVGIVFSIVLSILLNALDDKIYTVKEFIEKIKIPLIGTYPKLKIPVKDILKSYKDNEEMLKVLDSFFKEIYVNFKYMIVNDNFVYAVTSSIQGEGKTFLSLMLGKFLGKENKKVLLIDCDFYNPMLSSIFKIKKLPGLSDIVSKQSELKSTIIHNDNFNIDIIPAGKKPPDMERFFSSRNYKTLLKKLTVHYDFIILDTPPVLIFPECNNIFESVDEVILVAKILETTYNQIKRTLKRLKMIKGDLLGIILNFSRNIIIDKEYENYSYNYYKKYYKYKNEESKKNKHKEKFGKIKSKILKKIKSLIFFDEDEEI